MIVNFLKIGIVCYPTIGGSGSLATSLGIELARRGHEVHFISYERPFRLPPDDPPEQPITGNSTDLGISNATTNPIPLPAAGFRVPPKGNGAKRNREEVGEERTGREGENHNRKSHLPTPSNLGTPDAAISPPPMVINASNLRATKPTPLPSVGGAGESEVRRRTGGEGESEYGKVLNLIPMSPPHLPSAGGVGEEPTGREGENHNQKSPLSPNPKIQFHQVDIGSHELFKYPDYTLPLSVKMAEVSRAHRLDILHVHYAVPHATAAILALSMLEPSQRPRLVTTLHGTDTTLLGTQPGYGPAIKYALEQSDAVTAVSTFLEGETRRLLQITRQIDVIHNFVCPTLPLRSRKEVRAELGVGDDETLLIHASNLRWIKRIDLLLQVAALLKERDRFRLLILAGEPFAPYEAEVRRLGLQDRIIVRERIQNVEDYYSAADIGLVTSDSESFCLSILEGMFYGCPSVSTRVGGIPEVIQSETTGLLVPPGNAEALADAITNLIANPTRRQAMAQTAKRFAETHFTAEIIVPAYEQLYYREVGEPRKEGY